MKTKSRKSQKNENYRNENKNLVFKQREKFPNEYQLRIDNISNDLYKICYPQWIKDKINSLDRIYMRIRKNNNNILAYELIFSGFNNKISIDFTNYVAYSGNEFYDDEKYIRYQYKTNMIKLDKYICDELLTNIFNEFNELSIKYNI
jgi:hypothetical protein